MNPVGSNVDETNSVVNPNSQLKLLMQGKYVEPKKPEPIIVTHKGLKKKFKINPEDLPSI